MRLLPKNKSKIPNRRMAAQRGQVESNSSDSFMRNRTLSSYSSLRTNTDSDQESARAKSHRLVAKRHKIISSLAVVLLVIAVIFMIISHLSARVSVTVVNSEETIGRLDISKYEQAIQDYMGENPTSRLTFLLNQAALTAYVSNKMPEVETVTQVDNWDFGETNFKIKMRQPVAGWNINGQQYYVDASGVSFTKNYFATPGIQIVDNSGVSLQTGVASVSRRFLSFVGQAVSLSKASGYPVVQAILPAETTRELEIKLQGSNLIVKLSIDRPEGEQIEDMSRAVKYFTSHGQKPSYIDVRVSGKAFYK